jgi:peptidoglycan/LPS O-acetylase OafA/YrhL
MLSLRLQNPSPLPPGGRWREIDELKGFAMLLVILYHAGGVLGWGNWLHGEVGVDIFLIVSGFTLARNSRDLPFKDFLGRRLLRIFPAYWLALGSFLFLGAHFFNSQYSVANIVVHVLGLQGFALGQGDFFSAINDSFWFISLILLMYVVFLGIRNHLADLGRVIGTGLLLTAAACWAYLAAGHSGGLSQLAMRIPSFFIGLVAAQLSGAEESELKFSPLLATGAIALTYLGWTRGIIPFYALAGPAMVSGFLVIRRSLCRHPDGRFLLAGLALMGMYSYEIFLFHQPLIRDYNRVFWSRCFGIIDPSPLQLALGIGGGLALTFAISLVVHRTVGQLLGTGKKSPAALPANPANV